MGRNDEELPWAFFGSCLLPLGCAASPIPPLRRCTPMRLLVTSRCLVLSVVTISTATFAAAADAPLLKILDQFTAADVPKLGPTEPPPTTRTWWDPTTNPSTIDPNLPGKGIA